MKYYYQYPIKSKKLMIAIASAVVVLMLVVLLPMFFPPVFAHIEDTNGLDSSLCRLTEEDIFARRPSCISYMSVRTESTDRCQFSAKLLSGVYQMEEVSVDGGELIIYTDAVRKQGNLRIVLLCDGAYVADIPVSKDQRIAISNPRGNYEIRLAAESAELEFECSFRILS